MQGSSWKSIIASAFVVAMASPAWAADGKAAPPGAAASEREQATAASGALRLDSAELNELALFEGVPLEIKRNAELRLSEPGVAEPTHTSKLAVGRRGKLVPVESVRVGQGRVDVLFGKAPERGVLLHTEDQYQAIATGGRIAMANFDDRVAVAALEGPALVGRKGIFKPLLEGQVRVFHRASGTSKDRPLLGATTLQITGLAMSLTGGAELPLSVRDLDGAAGYRVQLLDKTGSRVGGAEESKKGSPLGIRVSRPGTYWAVVRALDPEGFGGAVSQPVEVSVLGVKNAENLVRHGLVYLAPGDRAEIVGQSGLVMRYGTSPEFVPAPQSINLPDKKATTVEFRDPAHPDRYAVLRLAPRMLKSRIIIGPATSTWPEDKIDISVNVWDGDGGALSWMDEYKLRVRVGLEEIPLEWRRDGRSLRASLPPQPGPGPWVIRLSIMGPDDEELARDFLEVIPTPAPPPSPEMIASATPVARK